MSSKRKKKRKSGRIRGVFPGQVSRGLKSNGYHGTSEDLSDRGREIASRDVKAVLMHLGNFDEWEEIYSSIGQLEVGGDAAEAAKERLQRFSGKYPTIGGPLSQTIRKVEQGMRRERNRKRKPGKARERTLDKGFAPIRDGPSPPPQPDHGACIITDADGPITQVPGGYKRTIKDYEDALGYEGMLQRGDMGRVAMKDVGLYHGGNGMFGAGSGEDRQLAYCLLGDLAHGIGPTDEAIMGLKAVAERNPAFHEVIYMAMKILARPEHERQHWARMEESIVPGPLPFERTSAMEDFYHSCRGRYGPFVDQEGKRVFIGSGLKDYLDGLSVQDPFVDFVFCNILGRAIENDMTARGHLFDAARLLRPYAPEIGRYVREALSFR